MATDMTIPEEKNMEALAESWDFLERELENFQRICAELEKELPSNEPDLLDESKVENSRPRQEFHHKEFLSRISEEQDCWEETGAKPKRHSGECAREESNGDNVRAPETMPKPKPPLLPKPKLPKAANKPMVPPKPSGVVQTSL